MSLTAPSSLVMRYLRAKSLVASRGTPSLNRRVTRWKDGSIGRTMINIDVSPSF
jgi:hypothetical protein